jgi:prolyl-tRNA editing enzyme YbaK/EbsC (Cys-tRNA(Pro) deacylase)
MEHSPTYTSQESALARGEDMSIGGKALLLKVGSTFELFVLSADRVVDNKKLKDYFKTKKIRFATNEELGMLTELSSGAVPPFGRPIFDLNLYADNSILENEYIAFNAGSLTKSIKMKVQDYIKVANPIILSFSTRKPTTI